MRAAFVRVDVVRKREGLFDIAVVPLHGDFGVDAVLFAVHVDRLVVHHSLVLVQVLNERDDATFVVERVVLAVAFIVERDGDAAVEEREFAKSLREDVEAVDGRFENLLVGLEPDFRSAALRGAGHLEVGDGRAAVIRLLVDLAVTPDFQFERFRERVDDGDADAVKAARHLVGTVLELAAGVQDGEHDFSRGLPAVHEIDGDATSVVDHRHPPVAVNRDIDLVAEASKGFVNRVVDDFIDQVMQPRGSGRPDVHRGALPDGFQTFENLDAVGRVVRGFLH